MLTKFRKTKGRIVRFEHKMQKYEVNNKLSFRFRYGHGKQLLNSLILINSTMTFLSTRVNTVPSM